MTLRSAALLLPLALLAACDRSEPEPVETRPQPILRGSVSDDMLHTDQMQAEAPLAAPEASGAPADKDTGATTAARKAPPREGNSGDRGAAASSPDDAREERSAPAATPQPKASPSPQPTP